MLLSSNKKKVALCFIINYEHVLHKENIWRKWCEELKDLVNVYVFYSDREKITSPWLLQHALPPTEVYPTNYYHIIPAYVSLMKHALAADPANAWFCMLTDSCCPIVSPEYFRLQFYRNQTHSIFAWRRAWWDVRTCKRANLGKLAKNLHLANSPWFIVNRHHACLIVHFTTQSPKGIETTAIIDAGRVANESLFAIILMVNHQLLSHNSTIIDSNSHITDWSRPATASSPHTFVEGNAKDQQIISAELKNNPYACFIRKIAPQFPDAIIEKYQQACTISWGDRAELFAWQYGGILATIVPWMMCIVMCVGIILGRAQLWTTLADKQ